MVYYAVHMPQQAAPLADPGPLMSEILSWGGTSSEWETEYRSQFTYVANSLHCVLPYMPVIHSNHSQVPSEAVLQSSLDTTWTHATLGRFDGNVHPGCSCRPPSAAAAGEESLASPPTRVIERPDRPHVHASKAEVICATDHAFHQALESTACNRLYSARLAGGRVHRVQQR